MQHAEPGSRAGAVPPTLLGPGQRLTRLAALLRGAQGEGVWRQVGDLADLFELCAGARLLLLDADELSPADLGIPLRLLRRAPQLSLQLLGTDPGAGPARRLLAEPRVAWMAWPPDLEQLEGLLALAGRPTPAAGGVPAERPAPGGGPVPVPGPVPGTDPGTDPGPARPPEDPAGAVLRRQVEKILGFASGAPPRGDNGAPGAGGGPSPPAPSPGAEPSPAGLGAESAPPAAGGPGTGTGTATAPHRTVPQRRGAAPWFRDQVADLADVVQRLELAFEQVRISAGEAVGGDLEQRLERLSGELLRLVQFTRTLGYLVAPPAPGPQRLELGSLLENQLLAARAQPDCPRYLFRARGELWTRSNRALLVEALDALLALAELCAGSEGVVRVHALEAPGPGPEAVLLRIRFPAGPLAELPIEQVLEPYGLRRLLPGLGPNALAAACGILAGQGGGAELHALAHGMLEWRIHLPPA